MQDDGSVETQADFAESVMADGIMDWLLDTAPGEEVPAEPALADTGSAEPARDEKGRFVSTKAEETQEAEEAPAEPAEGLSDDELIVAQHPEDAEEDDELVIEIDDTLQSVLDRYDGDITKALRALGDKESMIGRQANEVGELRNELSAMRQMLEQAALQPPQQPQYVGPYRNDLDDNPEGLLYEAIERGDGQTAQIALEAWGEMEPFKAAVFLTSAQQGLQQPQQQPAPPAYEQGSVSIEAAMADVVARHPDVEQHLPALGETAKEFPTLRNFMEQGTPAQKAQAFEELLVITKSRSASSATSEAMKRVVLKTQEEVRQEKAEAAVVSAQNQSAATSRSGLDDFFEMFDEAAERYAGDGWITRSND